MKFAFFSDIHLDHSPYYINPDAFPEVEFWLNAGDTASNVMMYDYFHSQFENMNYLYVDGNHDFYLRSTMIGAPETYYKEMEVNGIKIAGAPMWTDLETKIDWELYANGLIDMRYMRDSGWNRQTYNKHFDIQLQMLMDSNADIIVTHHAPSFRSVSKRFEGDAYNICFASELDNLILNMSKPPKYWFHGHMHDPTDYWIGQTHVICHPRGYPNENSNWRTYMPLILEI